MSLQIRRGLEADRLGFTPVEAEPIWTTDEKKLYVGDGATAGGIAVGGGVEEEDIAFLDNFADASRFWAWRDLNTSGGIRTIVESGSVLTLAHTAGNGGDWWSGNNGSVRTVIGLPGFPCIIETKLNSYTVNDQSHIGLFLSLDPYGAAPAANSAFIFGRLRNDAAAANTIYLQSLGGTINAAVAPDLTTLPIWLRFRIGNGNYVMTLVYADYSTDGINWTNLWSGIGYPTAYYYGLTTGLFDKVWGANNAISAPFEYFKSSRVLGPR